jgi:uncharacterized protein GlcG (DUF336 family)
MRKFEYVPHAGWPALTLAAAMVAHGSPTIAQDLSAARAMPRPLAVEAASEAVRACEASGYKVTAAVVDAAGETRVLLKGDGSTPHTKETAFRKAYTQVTLGPIFAFDTLGAFVEKMKTNPFQSSFLTVPNIILLPGAVAVKTKGEIVAAIGVGGAPGGEKDEACAAAGLAKIADRLPK